MPPLIQQANCPPPCLALKGFEKINRYWDRQREIHTAKILPGEYYVTTKSELITTVLGSCVSACIRDPAMNIGGMNHFMLPASENNMASIGAGTEATRYGNFAMELLINEILKNGGRRDYLEVKVFGGGNVIKQMTITDIGGRNASFVREYLATEGLEIVSQDLGDIYPRKVLYDPMSGKVQVRKLRSTHNNTVIQRETGYSQELKKQPDAGSIELFD